MREKLDILIEERRVIFSLWKEHSQRMYPEQVKRLLDPMICFHLGKVEEFYGENIEGESYEEWSLKTFGKDFQL